MASPPISDTTLYTLSGVGSVVGSGRSIVMSDEPVLKASMAERSVQSPSPDVHAVGASVALSVASLTTMGVVAPAASAPSASTPTPTPVPRISVTRASPAPNRPMDVRIVQPPAVTPATPR